MGRPNRGVGSSGVKRTGANGTRKKYACGGSKSSKSTSKKK